MVIVKITEENFLDFLDEIAQIISKSTTKDNGHIIWNGKIIDNQPVRIKFRGKLAQPHLWQKIISTKTWVFNANRYKKSCTEKFCISPDHFLSRDDPTDVYKLAYIRLMENSKQEGECRLFTGFCTKYGYGNTNLKKRITYAHILAMEIHLNGTIPDDKFVRHKCKNKNCFAIGHLELGTHAENMSDKIRDGTNLAGVDHPNAILTEEMVLEIFNSKETDTVPNRTKFFSEKFKIDISSASVYKIDDGSTWSHITKITKKPPKKLVKPELNQEFIDKHHEAMKDKVKNNISINEECWLWKGAKDIHGYGQTRFLRIMFGSIHRFSLMATSQKFIPADLQVRHKCANKHCWSVKIVQLARHRP
ncbi:MAG: putative homing endonuclease [Hyperionvirus sp.]|uniref:Putative homing endonuclease n=1 Tax=Hyperionvirus sp. TaxID=2487770 RepID=A0A3G5AE31_9VIRU|nr:MAG: putative homing endonuclease [Hyperionvirus sp.]